MLASVKDDSLILAKELLEEGNMAKDEWAKYRVISVLGQGSYGTVYKVERVGNSSIA